MRPGPGWQETAYRRGVEGLTRAVLSHRRTILALVLFALVLGLAGLSRLRVDFSAIGYFATDDQEIEELLEIRHRWGPDDNELLALVEVRAGTLLEPERVTALLRVARALERLPGVERVLALPDLPDWRRRDPERDDLRVRRLADSLLSDQGASALRREIVADSPYVPAVLSRDGQASLMAIRLFADETDDILRVRRRVGAVRRLLREEQGTHGMRFTLAGIPAVRADAVALLIRDQVRLVPVVLLSTCLILAMFLPFPRGVLVPLATAVVPPLLLFGSMGWVGAPVGILNQILFTLLPALAIADSIHLIHRFVAETSREETSSRLGASDRTAAIVRAMGAAAWPCFLTSLTTGLGFLTLLTTRVPALRELGLQAALGMLLAHGTVVVLVPLLLSLGGFRRVRRMPAAALAATGSRWLSGLLRRPGLVLAGTAGLVILFLVWGSQVVVDCRLTELLPDDHPTTAASRQIDTRLGGTMPLHVELLGAPGTFRSPHLLATLSELEAWAAELDGVRAVAGPAGFVAAIEGWRSGEAVIPSSGAGVVRNLVAGRTSGVAAAELVTSDLASARVVLRAEDRGGREFLRLAEQVERRFRDTLPEDVETRVGGTPVVAYRGTNALSEDLRGSLAVAYLAVGGCIALLWGRWRLGLLCLVLNTLPLLAAYGLVGALGWRFEPPVAVILVVGLGIAVDDTLHVLARALGAHGSSKACADAVRRAVADTAPALVTTSLVLGVAFAANAASAFPSIATFGLLGAVMVVTALVGDLVLLPAFFEWARPRERPGRTRTRADYLRRLFSSC